MQEKREKNTQLEECYILFGKKIGRLLYRAMNRIAWLGFEVSPTDVYDRVLVVDPQSNKRGYFGLNGHCLEYLAVGDSFMHLPDEVPASRVREYLN